MNTAKEERFPLVDAETAEKTALRSPPRITEYATHSTMLALTNVIEGLQKTVDKQNKQLGVAIMAINSQASKLEEQERKISELQVAAGGALGRMDFFLGCSLVANALQSDWDELTSGEMHMLIAEDAVSLNQLHMEFGS